MIRNNIPTNCPTYEEIMFLFPDSSDQRISGQFVYDDDGFYHREQTAYANAEGFYRFEKQNRFWVDPPGAVARQVKIITIEPTVDNFPIRTQKVTNSSIDILYGSLISTGCREAIISANDWQVRLGNMIEHIGSGCTKDNLDNVKKKTWQRTIHDITTSYKYKLEKWIAESLERCGQKVCFYE